MITSIYNKSFPLGKLSNFRDQIKNKYTCDVFQGDVDPIVRPQNSCNYAAGAWIPTGSIAYVDATGAAVAGIGVSTNSKLNVPNIVFVGNDHFGANSEKYNAAGGLVTLLPLTGNYRIITTVFDSSVTYAIGDLLTVGSFTFDGKTVYGVKKATTGMGTDVIVGIVDAAGSNDVKGNGAIAFTAFYRPVTA